MVLLFFWHGIPIGSISYSQRERLRAIIKWDLTMLIYLLCAFSCSLAFQCAFLVPRLCHAVEQRRGEDRSFNHIKTCAPLQSVKPLWLSQLSLITGVFRSDFCQRDLSLQLRSCCCWRSRTPYNHTTFRITYVVILHFNIICQKGWLPK